MREQLSEIIFNQSVRHLFLGPGTPHQHMKMWIGESSGTGPSIPVISSMPSPSIFHCHARSLLCAQARTLRQVQARLKL